MDSPFDSTPSCDNEVVEIEDDVSELPSIDDEGEETIDETSSKTTISMQQHFIILSESDIKQLQHDDINKVLSIISISRVTACLLLYHYEWSVTKVLEAWFENEEKVRKDVGLLKRPQIKFPSSKFFMCEICFKTISGDEIKSAGCDHPFCTNCWKQYAETKISEGPRKCLTLRCPKPSCDAAVDGDMIHQLTSESSKEKYDQFLFRSYVENNKKIKWCPAPSCEYAEDDDMQLWVPILLDKCLRDWHRCVDQRCNPFTKIKVQEIEEINEDLEVKRRRVKNYLDRYTRYYELWVNQGTLHIKRLSMSYERPEIDFEFKNDAWRQVIECRRVLKWIYVYGYHIPENEKAKMMFFEYFQDEAKNSLEILHHHVENELKEFLYVGPRDEFNVFRVNLINLISVTKDYFKNMVKALENGLYDVSVKNYVGERRSSEIGESSNQRENETENQLTLMDC